jgi:hypothetical protein
MWDSKFDPNGDQFTIRVANPQTRSIVFFLSLDLTKYNVLMCPRITFDGRVIDYVPINGIDVVIPLNESIGPYDHNWEVNVFDPKPAEGWMAPHQAMHTYHFRVMQPPEYDEEVNLKNLTVVSDKGDVLEPDHPFDPNYTDVKGVHYKYIMTENHEKVIVHAECHKDATGLAFNGVQQQFGHPIEVPTEHGETQALIQCQYSDDVWTKGNTVQRTYVLTIRRELELSHTKVHVSAIHPTAMCNHDDEFHHHKRPGWRCNLFKEKVQIVSYFNNSQAEMSIEPIGVGMPSGMPVPLYIPEGERRDYKLVLRTGTKTQEWPLVLAWTSGCATVACPPMMMNRGGNIKCHHGGSNSCTHEDIPRCCEESNKMTCISHKCPALAVHVPHAKKVACDITAGQVKCSDEDCCMRLCDSVQCPPQWSHIIGADTVQCGQGTSEKCNIETCCERRCSDFNCGAGFIHAPYADQMICSKGQEDHCHASACCNKLPSCTEATCPFPLAQRRDAPDLFCFGLQCTKMDVPHCCSSKATCEGYQCPKPAMALKTLAAYIHCAEEQCSSLDVSNCCKNVDNCGNFKCPDGTLLKKDAGNIQCDTSFCMPSDLQKCCRPAATCAGFKCPPCKELKPFPDQIFCPHSEKCTEKEEHICCEGKGWMVGKKGETCTAACQPLGGCVEDENAWPSHEDTFKQIARDVGVECENLQLGESTYDPSLQGRHCGWKAVKLDPRVEELDIYKLIRCDAVPPPQTQRFCVCGAQDNDCGKPEGANSSTHNIIVS